MTRCIPTSITDVDFNYTESSMTGFPYHELSDNHITDWWWGLTSDERNLYIDEYDIDEISDKTLNRIYESEKMKII